MSELLMYEQKMVVATVARSERLEPVCVVLIVDDKTRNGGRYCGSVGKT